MAKKKKTFKQDYVTLYTDASWIEDHGSWAFWAKADSGRLTQTGMLPKEINGSFQGEIYAICQGMHKVLKRWPATKGFYICSDSKAAMGFLSNPKKEKSRSGKIYSDVEQRLKTAFDKMVVDKEILMRHVKGHKSGKKSIRFWLNNWCDKQARKTRKEHKKTENGLH